MFPEMMLYFYYAEADTKVSLRNLKIPQFICYWITQVYNLVIHGIFVLMYLVL